MGVYEASKRGIMALWYWYVRKLNSVWPTTTIEGRQFAVFPGVYRPLENEHACAAYCREGDRVLDLGCGIGVGAIFCADKAGHVLATDISETALRNAEENCRRHEVRNIDFLHSDMFDKIDGEFDLVIANPPYIAADFADAENQYATSVRYLPLLFDAIHDHLAPGGRLLVQYPAWFRGSLLKLAASHGMVLKEERRMPRKSLGLALTSLLYLQVGFRSTFFLFEPAARKPAAEDAPKARAA